MKKKIKLFILLIVLLMPLTVNADMGSPMIRPYEMVVVAVEGIDYYDWDGNAVGHLDKDAKFTVEYEFNGGYSFKFSGDDSKSFKISSLTGAMLVTKELKPEEAIKNKKNGSLVEKTSKNNNALVYAEDGVDVRKGPSTVYDKVGHLAKGTKLKYLYTLSGGGITHIYVDSSGVKGWIDILDAKVLLETTNEYITSRDISLSCTIVPKNTILSGKYVTDQWTHKVLIEYGKCSDLYNYFRGSAGLLQIYESYYVAKDSLDVYENPDNAGDKLATISTNTKFKVLASDVSNGDGPFNYYVSYGGKAGWIRTSWDKIAYVNNDDVVVEDSNDDEVEENDITDSTDTVEVTEKMSPLDMTIIYIIAGAAISLSALVTIILINRKRKKKEMVSQEPVTEDDDDAIKKGIID